MVLLDETIQPHYIFTHFNALNLETAAVEAASLFPHTLQTAEVISYAEEVMRVAQQEWQGFPLNLDVNIER